MTETTRLSSGCSHAEVAKLLRLIQHFSDSTNHGVKKDERFMVLTLSESFPSAENGEKTGVDSIILPPAGADRILV